MVDSPAYVISAAEIITAQYLTLTQLEQVFCGEADLDYDELPPSLFEGVERFFRTAYTHELATTWFPAVEGLVPRLEEGAQVADVGSGTGSRRCRSPRGGPPARSPADRVPVWPRWPGEAEFPGEIRHAADVRRPRELAGRRVLIVGGGNSGIDLAGALLRVGVRKLWVSVRHGVTVLPRRLGPVPVHPLGVFARGAPVRSQDLTVGLTSRLAFGDLSRLGYPRPQQGAASLFATRGVSPAADDGFVAALRRGDATVVGPVARCTAEGVVLADGRRLDADVVVCATGYRPGLEPLVGHLDVLGDRGRPVAVPGPVNGWPGLWFAGQRPPFHGNLFERGPEARRLAPRLRHRRERSGSSPASRSSGTPQRSAPSPRL